MRFARISNGARGLCLAISALTALAIAAPSFAGEVNVGYFGNVAIKGYDPVAYFTERQAIKKNQCIGQCRTNSINDSGISTPTHRKEPQNKD